MNFLILIITVYHSSDSQTLVVFVREKQFLYHTQPTSHIGPRWSQMTFLSLFSYGCDTILILFNLSQRGWDH